MAAQDAVSGSSRPTSHEQTLCYLTPALVVLAVAAGSVSVVASTQDATARRPAPTLARPKTPTRATDAAGFLQRWLVLEPIRVTGQLTDSAVQTAVKTEYFPNQLTVIPRDGDTVTAGDAQLVARRRHDQVRVNLFHFAYALETDVQRPVLGRHRRQRAAGDAGSASPSARTPPRSGGSTARKSSVSTTTGRR